MNKKYLGFFIRNFSFFILSVCLSAILFVKTQPVFSSSLNLLDNGKTVIEHLRLKVPKEEKYAWLIAEQKTWESWLLKQNGFLGRELFWDPVREEATLLIHWESKKKWKSIPSQEINFVQEKFERVAREIIGIEQGNPFPLIFEGELLQQ